MKTGIHFTLQALKFFTDIPQLLLKPDDNETELSNSHYRNGVSGLRVLLQIWLRAIKASINSTLISLKCNLLLQFWI